MTQADLIRDICSLAGGNEGPAAHYPTGIPGLSVLYSAGPSAFEARVYDPVVCLILQGRKETRSGERVVKFGAGDSLIVSHSLPVMAAITEASPERPYVAMVLAIDLGIARSLHDEIGDGDVIEGGTQSLVASRTDPELIGAFARLFRAGRDPLEATALAPLIVREIHFRLLRADHGTMLRQMLWRGSAASRVGRVMARLRDDLAVPMTVGEMAKMAGMSVSAFHEHFKAISGTSPLQYQKELRLITARRLLLETAGPVSSIAFEVGYESPSQFSREYRRMFGAPPGRDGAAVRRSAVPADA